VPDPPLSLKLYRALLKLYPAAFREEYAEPMEQEYRAELASARGPLALASLWFHTLADLARSLPVQLAAEAAQDTRHALRLWRAQPLHIAFMTAALALAIGANTGIFSVVNALLFRSLPFQNAGRLAALEFFQPPHDTASQFDLWRAHSSYLADTALYEDGDFNIGQERMARAHAAQTSANFFALLGTRPYLGRTFSSTDHDAAVLGYGLWQELFAGSPRILGSALRVNGQTVTIIGIAPPDFDFPNHTALWKTAVFTRGNNGWRTIARLKDGVSWPQARAAFAIEAPRLWPLRFNPADPHHAAIVPLRDQLAGPARQASLLLLFAVGLTLLIACANVANLLLARTTGRAPELAIRSALGATRARLIQQILTECLLLAFFSALLGIAVAVWIAEMAPHWVPGPLAGQSYTLLDARVLFFAAALAVLSAGLFGVLPSLAAGYTHMFPARGSAGFRHSNRIRESLIALQVTLTVVLLASSVSVSRGFGRLMRADRGFDTQSPITVSVSIQGTREDVKGNQLAYFEQVLARLRALPGVRSATATDFLPLSPTGFMGGPFSFDGRHPGRNSDFVPVFSDYFSTMGAHLVAGRDFTDADTRSNAPVAVVNDAFVRQIAGTLDVLGHRVTIGREGPWKIVGVVKSIDFLTEWFVGESDRGAPQIFVPPRNPGSFTSTFIVRVNGRPENYVPVIRDTVRAVDPAVPVFSAETMRDRLDTAFARPRLYRAVSLLFAAFSVLLSLIGVYGMVSYAVAQRTREMGVRLALGATSLGARTLLLRESMLAVLLGLLCGIVIALASGRLLANLFEGVEPLGPAAYSLTAAMLAAIAAAGIWSATRPLARLHVADILRAE
jgi:predicted permease